MNRNYRSGKSIVHVSNDIIRPASIRLPTDMLAERQEPGSVSIQACESTDEEGFLFVKWIVELQISGTALRDCAALYRVNAQSRALEEHLILRKIPYLILGGGSFYERREVKDLLAYVRVAAGTDLTGESVARCINSPFRYLGRVFLEKIEAIGGVAQSPIQWTEIVSSVAASSNQSRQAASAETWVQIISKAQDQISNNEKPASVLDAIITSTRYIEWLDKEEGEESVENSHAANVRELVRIAGRFKTCHELLAYIDNMLKSSKRQREDRGQDRVILMSIHRSKGLEYDNVWICGCNEKILPHAKGDEEEERRLMYVAATRAKDRLVISYLKGIASRTGLVKAEPSRFLVDAKLVPLVQDET